MPRNDQQGVDVGKGKNNCDGQSLYYERSNLSRSIFRWCTEDMFPEEGAQEESSLRRRSGL